MNILITQGWVGAELGKSLLCKMCTLPKGFNFKKFKKMSLDIKCGWVAGWVGVEIEVNANSAPNWVGVGAGAELGKNRPR